VSDDPGSGASPVDLSTEPAWAARSGWLLGQLPAVMRRDRVIGGFVRGFEEIGDGLRDQIDDVEYELDIDLASSEMLSYLASWLGVSIDASILAGDDARLRDAQRRLIRAVGKALVWRGTAHGVEILLEALTDSRVTVSDSGGVFGAADSVPPAGDLVVVEIDHLGSLTRQQILAFLDDELPVGTRVELRVRAGE
jgi:phage tail-like protein